ncbi:MAG TPA: hypothetical protein VFV54_00085, partial [Thermoanaerobaculia bacterium]|nr:hypothetical protein [Thermoanaerobaculia bacterium]
MITAAAVRACRGANGVAALLAQAGFGVALRRIDPARWESVGVDPVVARGISISHAANHGRVEV